MEQAGYTDDPTGMRWKALTQRDRAVDGIFVYSVRTTGVYCRPSCPARLARRKNVAFHATCAEAEAAGFRPCKRCGPNGASQIERQAAAVGRACQLIDGAPTMPKLRDLARTAGFGTSHFHRVFKTLTGITPRGYASQRRAMRMATELRTSETITHALYDAGFNAPSRFYDTTKGRLGMTPTAFRDGGKGTTIRFAVGDCSLGSVLVAATAKGICAILLGDDPEALVRDLQDQFSKATIIGGNPAFEAVVARAIGFVETPGTSFDLPLDIRGTAFQQSVWEALRSIPPGATTTYGEVAIAIGRPRAARAVAAACAANKIAVAIPCHRVIQADGSLSGYHWGAERKRTLIAREAKPERPKGKRS